jgi:hypothetical protein
MGRGVCENIKVFGPAKSVISFIASAQFQDETGKHRSSSGASFVY